MLKLIAVLLLIVTLAAPVLAADRRCYKEGELTSNEIHWKLVTSMGALDEDAGVLLYENHYAVSAEGGDATDVELDYVVDAGGSYGRQLFKVVIRQQKSVAIYTRVLSVHGYLGSCFHLSK